MSQQPDMRQYRKAYAEIVQILRYISPESVEKIPKEVRDVFYRERNYWHRFRYDFSKSFEEQVLYETKVIFAYLYVEFWAEPEERRRIHKEDEKKRKKKLYERLKVKYAISTVVTNS